ncbi:zf-HC2 domain-containing protein [Actinoplanes bogorensis]|uniref:Zf-HC2 domain-containing protein n=1 Tax=Paractinoplanes bogorensis TaxID=1610840 RepID=A0ABS5YN93_9ACTN|nr:zf-HC2 domain-containing protein [Actinoplanes bogorensis]MBU2664929.1 zf-HC2 domain-containing protein [Actinoplanes bogorensis]
MTTHIPSPALESYVAADPGLDDAAVWAVEVHLENCAECRARMAEMAAPPLLALLDDVQVAIDRGVRSGPGPVRRHPWRRMVHRWAVWSVVPWIVTVLSAVLAAFLLDRQFPERPSLVLLLAPVAPLAGLAVAWSRRSDPAWEITAGTSRAGLEMLFRRTVVVLATVLPPLALAGWRLGMNPALWLLPALTFTAATLLLGGRIGVDRAAAVLGSAWVLVIVVPAITSADLPVVIRSESLPVWALAAVIGTVLTLLRAGDHQRAPR